VKEDLHHHSAANPSQSRLSKRIYVQNSVRKHGKNFLFASSKNHFCTKIDSPNTNKKLNTFPQTRAIAQSIFYKQHI